MLSGGAAARGVSLSSPTGGAARAVAGGGGRVGGAAAPEAAAAAAAMVGRRRGVGTCRWQVVPSPSSASRSLEEVLPAHTLQSKYLCEK